MTEIYTYNQKSGKIGKADSDQKLPDHIINTGATDRPSLAQWKAKRGCDELVKSGFTEAQSQALVSVLSLMRGSF